MNSLLGTQALLRKIQAIVETFDDGDEESKVPDVRISSLSQSYDLLNDKIDLGRITTWR
jgi:hypothetical protein